MLVHKCTAGKANCQQTENDARYYMYTYEYKCTIRSVFTI